MRPASIACPSRRRSLGSSGRSRRKSLSAAVWRRSFVGDLVFLHTRTEPWLSKLQIASYFGRSKRYVESLTAQGMPSRMMSGRRQYRVSQCEDWMRENGLLYEEE